MTNTRTIKDEDMLIEALAHLQSAMDLLDRAAAPAHIAAHADLAANYLQDLIPNADAGRVVRRGDWIGEVRPL